MKVTVIPEPQEVELDARFVRIVAPVKFGEEDMPNDFPLRNGDLWEATIDIDTGVILDWPGTAASFYMKVIDEGSYFLLDDDMNTIASIENGYVPNELIPGDYGDYISLNIDDDGTVTNWPAYLSVDEFFPEIGKRKQIRDALAGIYSDVCGLYSMFADPSEVVSQKNEIPWG